jgi:hypothetical protein
MACHPRRYQNVCCFAQEYYYSAGILGMISHGWMI